jgi:hypothetical protein
MSGRAITRKEMAEATREYLSQPHEPIELDRRRFLFCYCAEGGCRPHRAHFHEQAKFDREATGIFSRRKAPVREQELEVCQEVLRS